MPNQTKEVISNALIDLMAVKPVDKITVRDIVERCGVNRNTFYYHFRDIPDVVEYTMRLQLKAIMVEGHEPRSLMEMLLKILSFFENNRKLTLHVYKSMRRESFVLYMRQLSAYAVEQLGALSVDLAPLPTKDREIVLFFIKCFFEGILLDWVDSGMDYDLRSRLYRLSDMFGEDVRLLISRLSRDS